MTPKEKAIQLLDSMSIELMDGTSRADLVPNFKIRKNPYAKECALKAVDELIENHNKMKDFLFSEIGYLITSPEYFQEVKQEIEKF